MESVGLFFFYFIKCIFHFWLTSVRLVGGKSGEGSAAGGKDGVDVQALSSSSSSCNSGEQAEPAVGHLFPATSMTSPLSRGCWRKVSRYLGLQSSHQSLHTGHRPLARGRQASHAGVKRRPLRSS